MANHNKNSRRGFRKPITDTSTARNAAIDWEFVSMFTQDLQMLTRDLDWKVVKYLGEAVNNANRNSELGDRAKNSIQAMSFTRVTTLIMYLKENEPLLQELLNIAGEQIEGIDDFGLYPNDKIQNT